MPIERVELWYKDSWCEVVEVDLPAAATRTEAEALRKKAGERHWPAGPPASRLSPVNLTHAGWEGDPLFADECLACDPSTYPVRACVRHGGQP